MNHIDPHTLTVLEFPAVCKLLASYAASVPGKNSARALLPLTCFDDIVRLQQETTEVKSLLDSHVTPPLGGISDILPLIGDTTERRVPFEPEQLHDIAGTLEAAARVRSFFHKYRNSATTMWNRCLHISDFSATTKEIRRCIDEEAAVRDSASPGLNDLRRKLKKLEAQIHTKMLALMNVLDVQQALENRNLLTRNGRPVLAVKAGFRRAIPGALHDKSNTGATVFIEPHAVAELVNEFEDARFEERREVTRILWKLTNAVNERSDEIIEALTILAHVDLTCARARFSAAFNMIPPEITKKGTLHLKDARHPMLIHFEQQKLHSMSPCDAFSRVVPLTVRLGDDFNLLIITGPNTGGKTVALKTTGLLAMMAQCGMHIPADWGSTLPVFTQIFSDIGDEQSIEQSLSTFSSHMTHIVRILNSATDSTLVLLDELGSGTDPAEGAALGTAILEYLRTSGARVLVTTHLGALKTYAYTTPLAENASMEFNRKTFMPTYRLLTGQPGSSNALAIARRLGMPEPVLRDTEQKLAEESTDAADLINRVQETRVAAEQRRLHAEKLSETLKKNIENADREKKKALDEAHHVIELTVKDIQTVINDYVSNAANAPNPWGDKARELRKRIEILASGTPLSELQRSFVDSVKEGDIIYIKSFHNYGTVKKIRAPQSLMHVEIDGLLFDVPFSQVTEKPFARKDPRKKPESTPKATEKPKKQPEDTYQKLLPKKQRLFIESLTINDTAYAPVLKSAVTIKKLIPEKQSAIVKTGILEVELPLNRLFPCKK